MAAQLKIVRGSDSVDLLSGDDGFRLAHNGWIRKVAFPDSNGAYPSELVEALTLHTLDATSQNDLASKYKALFNLLRKSSDYAGEPQDDTPVYIRAQLDNESESYQAMIKSWGFAPSSDPYHIPSSRALALGDVLTLVRTPFWEGSSDITLLSTAIGSFGGVFRLADNIAFPPGSEYSTPGNVPMRIGLTRFTRENSSATDVQEIWAGVYTERFGDELDDFDASINWCFDLHGAVPGDDASAITDTGDTEYNAGVIEVDFATDTSMAMRCSTYTPMGTRRGRFLVLLRARTTGTRTYNVRMGFGYSGSEEWNRRGRVKIDSTSYLLYPIGSIDIPPLAHAGEIYNLSAAANNISIRIEAEVSADGTGDLYLDGLVFIPTTEGWIHLDSCQIANSSSKEYVEVSIDPSGTVSGLTTGHGNVFSTPVVEPSRNYAFPVDYEGVLVVAAQRASSHSLSDEISVRFDVYPRWVYFRGSDTW